MLYSLYYISIALISYLQLNYTYVYNICHILYLSGSRGTGYLGGTAELSISTADDDTCGDLRKYRCGNRQGSLVGQQIIAYTISEGCQRHKHLSLSLLPSSVRHFQNHMRKPLSRMVSASCRPSTKRTVVQKQCVSECRAKCKNTPAVKRNAKQHRYAHLETGTGQGEQKT